MLQRTAAGWSPRPRAALDALLTAVIGGGDVAQLYARLLPIARALNQGNLAQAVIGTQYLRLPPISQVRARKALRRMGSGMVKSAVAKAAVDDPDHPGWPEGAPDGQGGEFRPKDGADLVGNAPETKPDNDAKLERLKKTSQSLVRRALRKTATRVLTWRRGARIAAELGSNVIPGVGEIADAALLAELAQDAYVLRPEFEAAARATFEYVEADLRPLEELMMSSEQELFSSIRAFKKGGAQTREDLEKRFGSAGDGYDYHHIVEQSAIGQDISQDLIHSVENIVRLPRVLHEEITAVFNGPAYEGAVISLRKSLKGASYEVQRVTGIDVMKKLGLIL
ncbi:MAG: hypothetical protein PW843_22970 [Azospirillaceae bacterium]|nr:hypothetical protein [Azospirillaceae bacterium]